MSLITYHPQASKRSYKNAPSGEQLLKCAVFSHSKWLISMGFTKFPVWRRNEVSLFLVYFQKNIIWV